MTICTISVFQKQQKALIAPRNLVLAPVGEKLAWAHCRLTKLWVKCQTTPPHMPSGLFQTAHRFHAVSDSWKFTSMPD